MAADKKSKRKKSKSSKAKTNGDITEINGLTEQPEHEVEDVEGEDVGETPERRESIVDPEVQAQSNYQEETSLNHQEEHVALTEESIAVAPPNTEPAAAIEQPTPEPVSKELSPETYSGDAGTTTLDGTPEPSPALEDYSGTEKIDVQEKSDTEDRLAAAALERDQLRAEVTQLRKSLESIQQRHEAELSQTQTQIEETRSGKEHAETRYQKLLGQVNVIKAQLGERLKADAAELAQARTQVVELEEQKKELDIQNQSLDQERNDLQAQSRNLHAENSTLQDQYRLVKDDHDSLQSQLSRISAESEQQAQEISTLRSRGNLSQQNWARERDELLQREASAREEFEAARQAMQDWEVLAMEERSIREGMGDRIAEIEEQLSNQRESYDRAASERDIQSATVDALQRALQEIQEARKVELREMVETSQAQLDEIRKQLKDAEESLKTSRAELETTKQDLERVLPFEKEVKEKNLLIGKLRHEAVILNDHLTKALRFLKKGKPENNVDRQLVTNHFLQFLTLDRSDPKKFQILQLIAALLGWTDEQKESAGLARPGGGGVGSVSTATHSLRPAASMTTLRFPLSSFRRAPSPNPMPSITSPTSASSTMVSDLPSPSAMSSRSESLAELWSDFLEREAQDGASPRREGSVAGAGVRRESGMVSPTIARSPGPGSRDGSGYGRF